MLFKVKLIFHSLMVDAVLPSVIALQQSRPRQPWQAAVGSQNSLCCYLGAPRACCSVWVLLYFVCVYMRICIYMHV